MNSCPSIVIALFLLLDTVAKHYLTIMIQFTLEDNTYTLQNMQAMYMETLKGKKVTGNLGGKNLGH